VTGLLPATAVYSILAELSGTVTGLVGLRVYRQYVADSKSGPPGGDRHRELVRRSVAMLVVFTVCAFGYALSTIGGPNTLGFALATMVLASVSWLVFALRYAGRGHLVTRLRVVLLSAVVIVVTVVLSARVLPGIPAEEVPEAVWVAISTVMLGIVGVAFVTGDSFCSRPTATGVSDSPAGWW